MIENIRLIPLTKNQVALIDAEDEPLITSYGWTYISAGAQSRVNGKRILMHRLLLNPRADQEVDHINHNNLDNRRSNLRFATRAENARNRLPHMGRKFKGVVDACRSGAPTRTRLRRFRAVITRGGVRHDIGGFPTIELAARAYDVKAAELFGEFAFLNFPNELDESNRLVTDFCERFKSTRKPYYKVSESRMKIKKLEHTRAERKRATMALLEKST